jgi:hypothetical protein
MAPEPSGSYLNSLLFIHGTADQVLPCYLSEDLYERADEPKELVLDPEDGHGIERHRSEMLEKLYSWGSNLLLVKKVGTVYSREQADPAGDTMDFNPEDARKYLEDADYPASNEVLISTAESNGAPEDLIERLGTLGRAEFCEPDDVVAELRASPHPT